MKHVFLFFFKFFFLFTLHAALCVFSKCNVSLRCQSRVFSIERRLTNWSFSPGDFQSLVVFIILSTYHLNDQIVHFKHEFALKMDTIFFIAFLFCLIYLIIWLLSICFLVWSYRQCLHVDLRFVFSLYTQKFLCFYALNLNAFRRRSSFFFAVGRHNFVLFVSKNMKKKLSFLFFMWL